MKETKKKSKKQPSKVKKSEKVSKKSPKLKSQNKQSSKISKKQSAKLYKGWGTFDEQIEKLQEQINKVDVDIDKLKSKKNVDYERLSASIKQKKELESKQGLLMMRKPSGFIGITDVRQSPLYKNALREHGDEKRALEIAVKSFMNNSMIYPRNSQIIKSSMIKNL